MDVSSSRFGEIDALFAELLDAPAKRREEVLRAVAKDDPELATTVAGLLEDSRAGGAALDDLGARLRRTGSELLADRASATDEDPVGDGETVGRYRILRRVARGGWGTVYEAERADGVFQQRVALKVLRRGLDTEDVLTRFQAERQILATLEHPNIARLLDGGTTADGRPFLALEYVEGLRIDEHCERAGLSRRQRLALFVSVARAVHHAHRHLVVHRDLKPSNILVTPEGDVKLLDFGIAKILDPSVVPANTPLTRTGRVLLTPDYASPEQLRGEPPTTASDVYQLGLVLRRLLVGKPTDGTRADDPRRAEPGASTPAALRGIPSDLRTIVQTSLREEPERRYTSAERMADDVERYLTGRPISARPDTATYRMRRFLGRHRWVAPTAALVALLVVAWMATLQRQRDIARAEADRAQEVQRLLVDLFRSPDPFAEAGGPGRDVTMREALTLGADRLRTELEDRPSLRAELLGTVSDVLHNLGSLQDALALTLETLALEREVYGERSLPVAASLGRLGNLLIDLEQRDSAEAVLLRQVDITTELTGPQDHRVGEALFNLGRAHTVQQKLDSARNDLERAAVILRADDAPQSGTLVEVLQFLAQSYLLDREMERAVATGQEAVEQAERIWGPDHPSTARARTYFGEVLRRTGDREGAERELRLAVSTLEEHLGLAHPFTLTSQAVLAGLLLAQGDAQAAADVSARRVEGARQLFGEESAPAAAALDQLAMSLRFQGRVDDAADAYRRAIAIYGKLPGPPADLGFSTMDLARTYLEAGRFTEAMPIARESIEIMERLAGPEDLGGLSFRVAEARCILGRSLAGLGRVAEARPILEQALARFEDWPGPNPPYPECNKALEAMR